MRRRSTRCGPRWTVWPRPPRGEPRPGPVHLNVPWREPLAPRGETGGIRATDPIARDGRGDAPLTAVAPRPRGAGAALLDRLGQASHPKVSVTFQYLGHRIRIVGWCPQTWQKLIVINPNN